MTRTPPWLQTFQERFYYVIWIAPVPMLAVLFTLEYDLLPTSVGWLLLTIALLPWGASLVLLSRPLAEVRSATPTFLRAIAHGWGGLFDLAPWAFRLVGSAVIGVALGIVVWMASRSGLAAGIIGGIIALAIWLWTLLVFPAIEE